MLENIICGTAVLVLQCWCKLDVVPREFSGKMIMDSEATIYVPRALKKSEGGCSRCPVFHACGSISDF